MNARTLELGVGMFVVIGLLAIGYLAVTIGGARFWKAENYSLSARFTNVGGLLPGSEVRIAGVRVGSVRAVRLDPSGHAALVVLDLPLDLSLDDDTIASIRSNGLLGDKFVSLSPGGSGIPLQAGDVIYDTESSVDWENLISRFAFGGIGGGSE